VRPQHGHGFRRLLRLTSPILLLVVDSGGTVSQEDATVAIGPESVRVALTLTQADRDLLRRLSTEDRRTLSEQVAWLAEKEEQRREHHANAL
jgi:hypothetical protein